MSGEASVVTSSAGSDRSNRWRMRVATSALGGSGLLLAASTAVWPTRILAVRVPEVGDFTKGYEQSIWSWGRQFVYTSDGVPLDAFAQPDPVARLVLLVVVLLLAAAGVTAWLLRPGLEGRLLAAVGLALALATVAASVFERVSFDDRSLGLQPGLVDITTAAGWLEVAAAVLLALALALVVVPVALPGPANAASARVSAAAARLAGRRPTDPAEPASAAQPVARPVATWREGTSPGSTHTPSVGFRDDDEPPQRPRG